MKLFVWERVEKATHHWHPEAAVLVFAESLDAALVLAQKEGVEFSIAELVPTEVRECDGAEGVYIFPDAGCC